MRVQLLLGSTVVLLLFAGCGPSTDTRGRSPTGAVYQGKHVSEWGDQLKSPEKGARLEAAKVLLKMGKEGHRTREAIESLAAALSDESPDVRGWSVVALVYAVRGTPYPIGQKAEPVAALQEAAESTDAELRAEVEEVMNARRPAGAVPEKNAPAEEKKDANSEKH